MIVAQDKLGRYVFGGELTFFLHEAEDEANTTFWATIKEQTESAYSSPCAENL